MPTRLAALLWPLGEAGARKALRKLKCSNALTDEVTALEREAGGDAGSFSKDRPLGWDPVAAGNRAGDGMACNSNDRRQWRMQEVAVGAAASDTQAMRSGCWEPQPELVSDQTLMAKRLLGRYELPTIQRLTALCSARHPEQTGAFAALRAEAERLTAENACCRVSQLAVNGRDLMAAGVRPGPGLRQVLNALLEAVITGQTPNEKDALLAAAAQFSAS